MQTAEHSSVEIPSGSSTPLLEKNPVIRQEDKIVSTEREAKRSPKSLALFSPQDSKLSAALHQEITVGLHAGFYWEQAVTLLSLSSPVWEKGQKSVQALYGVASPFWLSVVGVTEEEKSRTLILAELPKTRFPEWLSSMAADSWPARCRLVRDVAVGLYQCRTAGATHLTWNLQQLYLDAQGRAQLLPIFSETTIAESDDVFALGQLLWCLVSRSTIPVEGWEQGKGLPRNCPAEVIALIRACTDSTVSARPSLKTLAKGLDVLWQRAEQGFSEALPTLPQKLLSIQKEHKYDLPSLTDPTATITATQLSQVQSSGSLNLLLVDDQTVSWLSASDPRYRVGEKLCDLRDSLAQPPESKASLPALQQEIQRTLMESPIEMLLWLGETGEDPGHAFQETAWRLWQAREWQAYRPGDPPPAVWLPLQVNLHQPSLSSPVFTRTHQPPEDVTNFTESEWQLLRSQFAPFWLVQGMGRLTEPSNLFEVNELHRAQGRTRLVLHSDRSAAFKLEESTYFMPHGADGQLLPARYARYTSDSTGDFSTWEGRYQGKIGDEAEEVISAPIILMPTKGLALNREKLVLPPTQEEKTNTLGEGQFGEVLRGAYDGQPVAVKRFKTAKLSASDQAQLKDEAKVMAELHSPFLVRSLGLSLESPPLLVMELAEGGSLYHRLKDDRQELPWVWRLRVLRDIALGLSVLHAHELLHRDLKSLNILLDAEGRAKLCDFGLSTLKSQAKETRDVGTLLWNAPEVLQGKATTPASDLYSFAILCWEVVTRRLPYKDSTTGKVKEGFEKRVQAGERETIPNDCPAELASVIQACWAQDPKDRPSASQAAQVLEGLWQQAVKAEPSQPPRTRQITQRPALTLESKRMEPLTLAKTEEKTSSTQAIRQDFGGLSLEALQSLMSDTMKQGVTTTAQEKKENSSLITLPTTASDSAIPPKEIGQDFSELSAEALHSLMPELTQQAITPVEKKEPHPVEHHPTSSSTTASHPNSSSVTSYSTVSSHNSSTSTSLDPHLKDLPSELLHSLMPELSPHRVTSLDEKEEKKVSLAVERDLTPSSLPSTKTPVAEFKALLAKSLTPLWQDKQSPSYILGVKLQLLRQTVLADDYITRELSCYIEPNGQSQAGVGQSSEPLYPWVQRELLQGPAHVLLLQGLAGGGKSTFNRSLLRALWQDSAWQSYRPGDPIPRAPIPVFIPLQSTHVNPQQLWDYYHHLPEIGGFTSEEIRLLQSDYHTIWIADGYDELPGQAAPNLYDTNHLAVYAERVKLIIGCRSQRVQALHEADHFMPHQPTGAPESSRYRTRHVSPFTHQQTEDYIQKYVAQHQNDPDRPKDWDVARYQAEFKAIPELETLIDTPFMLWMTLTILPELTKEQTRASKKTDTPTDKREEKEIKETQGRPALATAAPSSKTRLTRAALYDRFMDTWFTRQARKACLAGSKNYLEKPEAILGVSRVKALRQQTAQGSGDDVQVHWLKAAYRDYCLRLAQQLAQSGQVSLSVPVKETKVSDQHPQSDRRLDTLTTPRLFEADSAHGIGGYPPIPEDSSTRSTHKETDSVEFSQQSADWPLQLLGHAPDSIRLRQGCPLQQSSDQSWRFMHASLLDYFMTTATRYLASLQIQA